MNKHIRRLAVTVVGVVALLGATAGPVAAASPTAYAPPEVTWVGNNVIVSKDLSTATVIGKYRCYGGRAGTHLWVSVKQGPNVSEPDHTSSSDADAWYDTNYLYGENPDGLTVDCDGQWHVTRYVLKPEFGELKDGRAYVQFCLFDNTSTEDNFPQGFAYVYGFRSVKVPGDGS